MEGIYSSNIINLGKIESYFAELGYRVERLETIPLGLGLAVVKFRVPGFNPINLEGRLLERWQELPIE